MPENNQVGRLYLDATAKWLAMVGSVPITAAAVPEHAVDGILGRIRVCGADLVVMTTHGRGPVSRFFLGSVADGLLRKAPVPLLLVRPREPAPELIPEPAMQRLLIPLDGSALAEQVLEPALELARLTDGRCTLVRVVEIHSGLPDSPPGSPGPPGEVHVEEAQAYLKSVAGRFGDQGLPIRTCVVVGRSIPETVLEQARVQGSDLIALATHGRGGIRRLLLGSVADQVIQGATTPVLVYRPPEA